MIVRLINGEETYFDEESYDFYRVNHGLFIICKSKPDKVHDVALFPLRNILSIKFKEMEKNT